MKFIFAAAVAAFAMPVFAQDTPSAPSPAPQTAPMPATPPPSDPATTMSTPAAPAPTAPAGPTAMAAPAPVVQPLPDAPDAADGKVLLCSRSVTDHCLERSNARGERLHSTPRAH